MKALLIVDMQNDFMPDGALGIPKADEIIPKINELARHFSLVVACMDWHPKNHVSFASMHHGMKPGDRIHIKGDEQILWPDHCVENSHGAAIVPGLNLQSIRAFFHKGVDPMIDSYSAFFDNTRRKSTGLADYLFEKGVKEIVLVGVATEYCVLYSSFDAMDLGFSVIVIKDLCRPINLKKNDEVNAFKMMLAKRVKLLSYDEYLGLRKGEK